MKHYLSQVPALLLLFFVILPVAGFYCFAGLMVIDHVAFALGVMISVLAHDREFLEYAGIFLAMNLAVGLIAWVMDSRRRGRESRLFGGSGSGRDQTPA